LQIWHPDDGRDAHAVASRPTASRSGHFTMVGVHWVFASEEDPDRQIYVHTG
jgi:hypothetical protein